MSHLTGPLWRGICAKLLTIPLLAFALGIVVPGVFGYLLIQNNAQREVREKSLMLLRTYDAVHRFAENDISARLGPKARGTSAATGSYAVREVARIARSGAGDAPYEYRMVSTNPVNPANRADAYEARLIAALEADHNLRRIEEQVSRPGGRYQVIATPVEVSQDACLSCHSSAASAPPALTKQFGRQSGFGWRKGQVVGASVVYVASDYVYAQAMGAFGTVAKVVAILVVLTVVILGWRINTLVARPVSALLATCQAIRRGDWGARFSAGDTDELGTLARSFQDTTMWLREQVAKEEKLRSLFQQFIPASVAARALGKDADDILAGQRHPVTVMVINIRNFKLLMEYLPPEQTVATLNEYFSEVNKVIVANHGLVSKYLGDTVMAFFGMPVRGDDHALNAVRAAMRIPPALQNLYVRLDENFGWQLGVGIGISTGEPIVGHFGSSEHMEYTVLGEVVAEADALEALSKGVPEEDTIVINESTYRQVMSDVHVFHLGEKDVAGGRVLNAYVVQGLRSEARSVVAA